ncbi:MAG: TonB-dependent receptor plug domain-containing protein, partial [Opitutaceae bacterium]
MTILAVLVSAQLYGQATGIAAPTPAVLAKYDVNKNGVLDPSEAEQMRADEAAVGETVKLTPFEVSTDKDIGYAAGNTLSGGRIDTPLAITPGSISVMTKEFLDDFNITTINEAAAWTIGMDGGTSTPNSDSSTNATYQAIFRGAPSDQNFPTRNGSLNFGVADSYNSERFEFSRGPDSSMFGDGGPGGRQGSSSKRARLDSTATSLTTQIDNYGGYRATLDYNKGWERFALRLNGVRQSNKPHRAGMNRIKNGITIATTVKLTKNTQFLAEFERGAEWNNVYSNSLSEFSQYWNNTTINENNTTLIANPNNVGLEQISATNDFFVWNFGVNEFLNYKGVQYRTRGTGFRIPFNGNPNIPPSPVRSFPGGIAKDFHLAPQDYFIDRDNDMLAFTLEHRAGNLFLQAGIVRNNFDINTPYGITVPNEYRIDVNKLLPDGRLNPNFLRAFADVGQATNYSQDRVNEYKGLATYRFFVPRFFDYKQQLSLNLGYRETKAEARSNSWRRADNPLAADPFAAANALNFRYYWDLPRPKVAPILTDPNKVLPGKWVNVDTAGNKADREVEYLALISQSAFFNEKLAITASVRRDEVGVDALPRFGHSGAPDYKNVLGSGAPGVHIERKETVVSTALGVVAYPFPVRFRALSPLGFVVNFAENSQAPGGATQRPLLSGEEAPLTHSKTMDFGLRYSVPGGRAYLTVSHYNTDQQDIVGGFGSQTDIRNIWLNLGYTDPLLTTSEFNYSDTSSRKLEGWEVELTANPWRNLTLTANYSHPLAYIQSESVDRKAYVAEHLAEWQAGAALPNGSLFNGRTIIDSQLIRDGLRNIEDSLNGLTTGALSNDSTRHRINLAARYAFREGRLRGLAF